MLSKRSLFREASMSIGSEQDLSFFRASKECTR